MAGGGIGEAMLISAAIGGGSAAITGGDPLKGALLGGLGGAVAPGLGSMFGETAAATTAAAGAPAAATTAATTAATGAGTTAGIANLPGAAATAVPNAAAVTPTAIPPSGGITNLPSAYYGPSLGAEAGNVSALSSAPVTPVAAPMSPIASAQTSFDSFGNPAAAGSPAATMADPTGLAEQQMALNNVTPKSSFQTAMEDPFGYIKNNKMQSAMAALAGATGARKKFESPDTTYRGPLSRFRFNPETYQSAFAEGGISSLASDGYDRQVGEDPYPMASGGISNLGSYSDGGRMLKGPGDGMSDSIPASIANKRPARLADGEFVVPADVVSHLGNGSTDAGAKQLYAMMNKVRQARTGRKAQGREINPNQYVPA